MVLIHPVVIIFDVVGGTIARGTVAHGLSEAQSGLQEERG